MLLLEGLFVALCSQELAEWSRRKECFIQKLTHVLFANMLMLTTTADELIWSLWPLVCEQRKGWRHGFNSCGQRLPAFYFTYEHPRKLAFAKSLVEFGTSLGLTAPVEVKKTSPSSPAVHSAIEKAPNDRREKVKIHFLVIIGRGEAVTCDGMKQSVLGPKFYDYVLHFIYIDEITKTASL